MAHGIYVTSSATTAVGVGNIMVWDVDDVQIDYDKDREEGGWRVVEKNGGHEWFCMDLVHLESSSSIEINPDTEDM